MLRKTRECALSFILFSCAVLCAGFDNSVLAQARFTTGADRLRAWVSDVGARREPKGTRIFSANSYGAVGNELKNSTRAIQRAIDACSKAGGGTVTLKPGKYVNGALFLQNDLNLRV